MRLRRRTTTHNDITTAANKLRYDLSSAQAQLTDLLRMIATLDIPSEEQPVSEKALAALVHNTRHEYTEASLREELAERGAPQALIEQLMKRASDGFGFEIAISDQDANSPARFTSGSGDHGVDSADDARVTSTGQGSS